MRRQMLLGFLLFLAVALLSGCQKKQLDEDALVASFSYMTAGMMMGGEKALSIARDGDGFVVTKRVGETVRSAHAGQTAGEQVTDILREHNALSWNGFAKSNPHVLDGTSFTLSIVFDDGKTVFAQGANSWPKGMAVAVREIEKLIDRFLRESEQ